MLGNAIERDAHSENSGRAAEDLIENKSNADNSCQRSATDDAEAVNAA
jgi:hypothetical protein